jgi:hypothetical protein
MPAPSEAQLAIFIQNQQRINELGRSWLDWCAADPSRVYPISAARAVTFAAEANLDFIL